MTASRTSVARNHLYATFPILFLVSLLNYIDRTIPSILQVPIKSELRLSDSQLGMITGLAFALFYCTLALPVARLADRFPRKYVLAIALTIWTSMTAMSALAFNFGTLLLCRIGVAAGEAGSVSPIHSMLSDYFPPRQRATAMSSWSMSLPFGVMLGFFVGGSLAVVVGWRHTFAIIGAAGAVLVPLIIVFVREPKRGAYDGLDPGAAIDDILPFSAALRLLWSRKTYRYLCLATAFHSYSMFAISTWSASYYSRSFGMRLGEIAIYLALIQGVGGGLGTFLGGWLVQPLSRRDMRWFMWLPALASIGLVPLGIAQFFVGSEALSLLIAVGPALMSQAYLGPINTVQQTLAPANLRALSSAWMALVVGLIGIGLGPLAAGVTSDLLAQLPSMKTDYLRYAITIQMTGGALAGALYLLAARNVRREMKLVLS